MDSEDPRRLLVALDTPEIADIAPWIIGHVQQLNNQMIHQLAERGIIFSDTQTFVHPELIVKLRQQMLTAMNSAFTVPDTPAPAPPQPEPTPPPVAAQASPDLVKQLADGIAQALAQSYSPVPMGPTLADLKPQYSPPTRPASSSRYPLGAFLASGGA
jgi:hypothetical protein